MLKHNLKLKATRIKVLKKNLAYLVKLTIIKICLTTTQLVKYKNQMLEKNYFF